MNVFFTIGAILGWLIVSRLTGGQLPLLSLQGILVVAIGGVAGIIVGAALKGKRF